MQGPQHNDPSRDARQLPSGMILSQGTVDSFSTRSHATTPYSVPANHEVRKNLWPIGKRYADRACDAHDEERNLSPGLFPDTEAVCKFALMLSFYRGPPQNSYSRPKMGSALHWYETSCTFPISSQSYDATFLRLYAFQTLK